MKNQIRSKIGILSFPPDDDDDDARTTRILQKNSYGRFLGLRCVIVSADVEYGKWRREGKTSSDFAAKSSYESEGYIEPEKRRPSRIVERMMGKA